MQIVWPGIEKLIPHAISLFYLYYPAGAGPVDKSDYLQGTHGHVFLRKKSANNLR